MPYITIQIETKLISEEEGYETEDFEYEYDYDILKKEIINEFSLEYDLDLEKSKKIIEDLDLYDILEERYEYEIEETLKDKLYRKACRAYREQNDY